MMDIKGLEFSQAWPHRLEAQFDDVTIFLISKEDLLISKIAAGRPQDLIDAERLKQSNRGGRNRL